MQLDNFGISRALEACGWWRLEWRQIYGINSSGGQGPPHVKSGSSLLDGGSLTSSSAIHVEHGSCQLEDDG